MKSRNKKGRFVKGIIQIFEKICKDCNKSFIANSGNTKFCDICKGKKSICPECNGKKSIYHQFCGNSCAGKWKYRNSNKVKDALKSGLSRCHLPDVIKKRSNTTRGKPRYDFRGQNNPNWKGGCREDLLRGQIEYINWRNAVFERDNYTCVWCGQRGGKIQADHIKPRYWFNELTLDINNGRTLCIECHKKTDSYGHKVKTIYKEKHMLVEN